MSRLLNTILLLTLLLAACVTPTVDHGPLTVAGGTATVTPTPRPTSTPTLEPTPTATPTLTEAPLTLTALGIPVDQQPLFQGLLKHIHRESIDGQEVLVTSGSFSDGEQRYEAKYTLEQGTFDAHLEIYDDLTRPLTVEAYRLGENGERIPVTLLWQGPERGFREAIDLSGAYDPELTQIDKHPYLHIVHGDRPIRSIKDLPAEDERLTLLQSIRLEQAKAIRAIQAIHEKLQNGEKITAEDLQGSVFLRRLQQKLQAGKKITEDDLYILFSSKALENWQEDGLSLFFELRQDGSKIVYLKSRGDSKQANKKGGLTYENANTKLAGPWVYTKDEQGNRHDMAIIAILDADDVQRYQETQDPLAFQGKFVLAENDWISQITPENLILLDLRKAYDEKSPLFPYLYVYAEGPILDQYPRLRHLLSLPDNKASEFEFWKYNINYYVQKLREEENLIEVPIPPVTPQCPPELQLLELMFDVRISN